MIDHFDLTNNLAKFNASVLHKKLSGGSRQDPHICNTCIQDGLKVNGTDVRKLFFFCFCAVSTCNGFGLMFLNEVALGKEHTITRDNSSLKQPPAGFDSVVARGQQEPGGSSNPPALN